MCLNSVRASRTPSSQKPLPPQDRDVMTRRGHVLNLCVRKQRLAALDREA